MYVHILVQSFQTLTMSKELFFFQVLLMILFLVFNISIFIHKSIMLKFCLSRQNFRLIY